MSSQPKAMIPVGSRYGLLTVTSQLRAGLYRLECACGRVIDLHGSALKRYKCCGQDCRRRNWSGRQKEARERTHPRGGKQVDELRHDATDSIHSDVQPGGMAVCQIQLPGCTRTRRLKNVDNPYRGLVTVTSGKFARKLACKNCASFEGHPTGPIL